MFGQRASDRWVDQDTAQHRAADDGQNGQPFNPAIALDEQFGLEHFRDDAVFGGGVGGSTDTNQGVGDKDQNQLLGVVHAKVLVAEHQHTANQLDGVGGEHDSTLGIRVGKSTYKRRQQDVGQCKPPFHHRDHPDRSVQICDQGDSGNQQGIVSN